MTLSLQTDVPLADKTTLRIGGSARYYLQPASREEISEALAWASDSHRPVFVLGKGSNVLISDAGWPGLVIDTSARFDAIAWNNSCAECLSGAPLQRLVREMLDRSLAGLEALGGIPGSIGGALFMNAGAFGRSIMECVESIDYIDLADAAIRRCSPSELQAGYRSTIFRQKEAFIVSGQFRFQPDPSGKAKETFGEVIAKRKVRHPLDLPNCGSVFKNPPNATAGSLIEQCGLKGFCRGGVEVSQKHANFIVNRRQGTAAQVRGLIAHIQKTVFGRFKVLLEPEVIFIGEFEEPLFCP